jgi:hypothetical protein
MSDDEYAFVVMSVASSHALVVDTILDIWFVDSGASKNMTNCLDWFTNFQPMHEGTNTV